MLISYANRAIVEVELPISMNPIALSIFSSQIEAICDDMGLCLMRSAFSTNIKDRLDFSCAIFDKNGELCTQAAHIPVHMGSMMFAMKDLVSQFSWQAGDMMVLNDPYNGGTHLPDVTMVAPVFTDAGSLIAFVVNRAHHANIGATTPGSMPVSGHIDEEGLLISPQLIIKSGHWQEALLAQLCVALAGDKAGRDELSELEKERLLADFYAQVSANKVGESKLSVLINKMQPQRFEKMPAQSDGQDKGIQQAKGFEPAKGFEQALTQLNEYASKLAKVSLRQIRSGQYYFEDYMDDDGQGTSDIKIALTLSVSVDRIELDFAGSSEPVAGNINCPLAVTAAAVYYVFRSFMPDYTPNCSACFECIQLKVPEHSLLNAKYPAAVTAGNVETSMRIVDVVLGAIAQMDPSLVPAASQGSMNNVAMGGVRVDGESWHYYETIAGGAGASDKSDGLDAVQSHMTNTLNTPIEILEQHYPLRIESYHLNRKQGVQAEDLYKGGKGLVREYLFTEESDLSVLSERRRYLPWGLNGGGDGSAGINELNGKGIDGKIQLKVKAGDRLKITTPAGGSWGRVRRDRQD